MDINTLIPVLWQGLLETLAMTIASAVFASYEVIFVNDGSTDNSWKVIENLRQANPAEVKGIKFRRNYGKSPALYCGFDKAEGDVVVTMDADLQDSPDEIGRAHV